MAEENKETMVKSEAEQVEVSDRGLFGFGGKKAEEKSQEEVLVTGVEKLHVEEKKEEEKELRRSHSSSSSSSSDEEVVGPDGEKMKKKKGLKEKIKEKLAGGLQETETVVTEDVVVVAEAEDTAVVVDKVDETVAVEAAPGGEKKGFLEKIKEKLPGGHKKEAADSGGEAVKVAAPPHPHHEAEGEGHDVKEKKGFLGKIMDKLPGHHKEEADKSSPTAGH